jgi:hypothetical protein
MDGVDGEEELAGPTRAPRSLRWIGGGAALVAVAIIGVQIVDEAGSPARSRPTASPASVGPNVPPWPRGPSGCGSVLLPIVASVPTRAGATGLTVLLGGDHLRRVRFDPGTVAVLRGVEPANGESITQLRGTSPSYAVLSSCDPTEDVALLRLGAGAPEPVDGVARLRNVIPAAGTAWAVIAGPTSTTGGTLRALDGPSTATSGVADVATPRGFTPLGVIGSQYVGEQVLSGPFAGEDPPGVQIRALRNDAVSTRLGRGRVIAVTATGVLWLEPCTGGARARCTLRYRPLAARGTAWSVLLPAGQMPTARGVVSPDGGQVAFPVQGNRPDDRYPSDAPPTSVAVLDTTSGSIELVPGVELPAAPVPGLAFSADGWLVLALNNGPTTRLLAWRSGLARPFESTPVHAVANGRPPVIVVPD